MQDCVCVSWAVNTKPKLYLKNKIFIKSDQLNDLFIKTDTQKMFDF